jgi:hypothetical protein
VRLTGCPVSVAEQVLALLSLGNTKNPYWSAREIIGFNKGYLRSKAAVAARRLRGLTYQTRGPARRGDGAPEMPSPGMT